VNFSLGDGMLRIVGAASARRWARPTTAES
jgi:hypothetical protein